MGGQRTVEGRCGGTLTPHPKGSNGGVHRGPDIHPFRRHTFTALLLECLVKDGISADDLLALKEKRKKSHRTLVPMAVAGKIVRVLENIVDDALLRRVDSVQAYGPFLRLFAQAHAMVQPAKGEKPPAQPIVPIFRGPTGDLPRVTGTEESQGDPAPPDLPLSPTDGYE